MRKTMMLAAILLFCFMAGAQTPDDVGVTNGAKNGRYWRSLQRPEKIIFLVGYAEGFTTSFDISQKTCNGEPGSWAANFIPKLTYGEMASALDRLYIDTPENGPIPIGDALLVVGMKTMGIGQSELDKTLAALRAKYQQ